MTEDGLRPISEVEVGELVQAYNEERGEIGFYPVEVVFEHLDPEIVTLVIDGETIETTPNHPFYEMVQVPGNADGELIGIWTGAGELVEGDAIFTANGGVEGAEWGGQGREWLVLSLH